jgi:hypothetical protein
VRQDGSAFRREEQLSDHKFKVGQLVHARFPNGAGDVYQITQLLPPTSEGPQYRMKSQAEPHERVAKESALKDASH